MKSEEGRWDKLLNAKGLRRNSWSGDMPHLSQWRRGHACPTSRSPRWTGGRTQLRVLAQHLWHLRRAQKTTKKAASATRPHNLRHLHGTSWTTLFSAHRCPH